MWCAVKFSKLPQHMHYLLSGVNTATRAIQKMTKIEIAVLYSNESYTFKSSLMMRNSFFIFIFLLSANTCFTTYLFPTFYLRIILI